MSDTMDSVVSNVVSDEQSGPVTGPIWDMMVGQAQMLREACPYVRRKLPEVDHVAQHFGEPCSFEVAALLLLGDPDPRDLVAEWSIDISSVLIKGTKMPLNLNDRKHWGAKAAAIERVKSTVRNAVRTADIPHLDRVHVEMHFRPAANNIRDVDNLVGTLKPAIDALHQPDNRESENLDEARQWTPIVDGDDPRYVTWRQPVLHRASKGVPAELWLVLRSYGAPSTAP